MNILFQNILEISAFSSLFIIFLAIFSGVLGRRYGVKWRYFVWMVIALRLIFPFHFNLPYSVVNTPLAHVTMESIQENNFVRAEEQVVSYQSSPSVKNTTLKKEIQPSKMEGVLLTIQGIWKKLWVIWLLGMVFFFAYQGKKYRSFLKNLDRNSRSIRDAEVLEVYYGVCKEMEIEKRPEIFFCGILPSPLCMGLFHQKLYLNFEDYTKEQLGYILQHELVHCKRRDIWYKTLLMIAKGIHFFNPFVHWMVRLAERDLEYFCDSVVLAKCSLSQREKYGFTILQSIRQGQKGNPLSTAFHGDKEALKARIDHIFDMGKKKRGILLLMTLGVIIWMGTAFVGCGQKGGIIQNTEKVTDEVSTLFECKLDYIGNHIGVGGILGNLTLPKGLTPSNEGIELFTKNEPYGARQYLTLEQGYEIPENGWFEKNAMIFLALVDNASFLEYSITNEKGEERILHFDREDGVNYFGNIDLRTMSVDESAFRSFMQELDTLFPQMENTDDSLQHIRSDLLIDEIAHEMGDNFSYEALLNNKKYDELLKLGDEALATMLMNFERGQADDTKGYIMLAACLELLQVPASVDEALIKDMTPSQWYEAYRALDSMMLEPFVYDENKFTGEMEKKGLLTMKKATEQGLVTRHSDELRAVYKALEQQFSSERSNRELLIYAPLISHISKEDDTLTVYAVIGDTKYSFIRLPQKGYYLIENGGSSVPARLDFELKNGSWVLVNWVEAKDGSDYVSSIEQMCKDAVGVANDLISYDTREMQMLLMQNLIFYLDRKTDITVCGVSRMEEKDIKDISQYIHFEKM